MVAALKRTRTRAALMQDIADLERDKRELLFLARGMINTVKGDPEYRAYVAGRKRGMETSFSTITGRCTLCGRLTEGHEVNCLIAKIFG